MYDAKGCLVRSEPYSVESIDTWSYTYDAKARLTSAWRRPYGASDFQLVVSNRYDHLDRRVQKITPEATHTYFYDGWLLVKEIRIENGELRMENGGVSRSDSAILHSQFSNLNSPSVIEYHWGKDLSGTIGGAGGVGGLLYLKRNGAIYVPWYDAYGNVIGYWDAQGNVVAEYTYDAFGKLIASSGPMANVFSLRYSTKYFDPETRFYYYGYRFYSPELKRWITRDPIGEEGGVNLYLALGNNMLGNIDPLGTQPFPSTDESWRIVDGSDEAHNWNCAEWTFLTDHSACGTQAKYVAHFKEKAFGKGGYLKVPDDYVNFFSYGIISKLEMDKDTKSAWCMNMRLDIYSRKRGKKEEYKIRMKINVLDKHPTLKSKPEISIRKFIGKVLEYGPK